MLNRYKIFLLFILLTTNILAFFESYREPTMDEIRSCHALIKTDEGQMKLWVLSRMTQDNITSDPAAINKLLDWIANVEKACWFEFEEDTFKKLKIELKFALVKADNAQMKTQTAASHHDERLAISNKTRAINVSAHDNNTRNIHTIDMCGEGYKHAQVMNLPDRDMLSVRRGPGKNFEKNDELPNKTIVAIIKNKGLWYKIIYGCSEAGDESCEDDLKTPCKIGWVYGKYLHFGKYFY